MVSQIGDKVSQVKATLLLVGKPGTVRDALYSFAMTIPSIGIVMTADTGLLALKMFRETRPTLVLIGNVPDAEAIELVLQVKQVHSGMRCLVLTEKSRQHQRLLDAGVDRVLPNGLPFGELSAAIQQLLRGD